ncbi:lysozyme-like domain-containing protein [Obelidium mucronatum]|nr:lysozyme-like domain-containing protein [Obelidium mucronatum]
MYDSVVRGFTSPLPGGLQELAILLGNLAHESGGFTQTKEWACQYGGCAYGWYYGRGYIQLTWHDNYQKAADYLGRPDIVTNPDVVSDDEYTNWEVVQWFWTSTVQPHFQGAGVSMGASVYKINGFIECWSLGGGGIDYKRVGKIQCFQNQLVGWAEENRGC